MSLADQMICVYQGDVGLARASSNDRLDSNDCQAKEEKLDVIWTAVCSLSMVSNGQDLGSERTILRLLLLNACLLNYACSGMSNVKLFIPPVRNKPDDGLQ